MQNLWQKIKADQSGFSLTEVLIGMMILSVAIVTGTNLLVDLVKTNQVAGQSVQAYYLAQEGIESVRNMRDSNWLHNRDWLGDGAEVLWERELVQGREYAIDLNAAAWNVFPRKTRSGESLQGILRNSSPWTVVEAGSNPNAGVIYRYENQGDVFFSSALGAEREDTGFRRVIEVLPYEDCEEDDCEKFALVRSTVSWEESGKDREVSLESILTDWKGGVL